MKNSYIVLLAALIYALIAASSCDFKKSGDIVDDTQSAVPIKKDPYINITCETMWYKYNISVYGLRGKIRVDKCNYSSYLETGCKYEEELDSNSCKQLINGIKRAYSGGLELGEIMRQEPSDIINTGVFPDITIEFMDSSMGVYNVFVEPYFEYEDSGVVVGHTGSSKVYCTHDAAHLIKKISGIRRQFKHNHDLYHNENTN